MTPTRVSYFSRIIARFGLGTGLDSLLHGRGADAEGINAVTVERVLLTFTQLLLIQVSYARIDSLRPGDLEVLLHNAPG